MFTAVFNPFNRFVWPLQMQELGSDTRKRLRRLENSTRLWGMSQKAYEDELTWIMEREAYRVARAPRLKELTEQREKIHAAMQHEFEAFGGRDNWLWHQGQTCSIKSLAEQIGLSYSRALQIFNQRERYWKWRASIPPFDRPPVNKGRPIDMGGPRDVWLTFYPSANARVDNMESVRGE